MVIQRMEERVLLLKGEVEGRGFKWGDDETRPETVESNGLGNARTTHSGPSTRPLGGRFGDEELARRIMEQMEEDDDNETRDGVYL